MPTLKRGDLEKAVMNLGFSRRKARRAVQNTFKVMAQGLARDRRMPLELGSGDAKEIIGELTVKPRSHRRFSIGGALPQIRRHIVYERNWQVFWEDTTPKKAAKRKRSAPQPHWSIQQQLPASEPPRQQMPAMVRVLPSSSLPWRQTSLGPGRRTKF